MTAFIKGVAACCFFQGRPIRAILSNAPNHQPPSLRPHSRLKHIDKAALAAARKWHGSFTLGHIPPRICDLSFSRSSGPGGQNVNKVSSKATLRVSLSDLLPLLPSIIHQPLRLSPQYAKNSDSLLIQADESRKQSENIHACFVRLHKIILDAAAQTLPGETSGVQHERVKQLQKTENEKRIKLKKAQSLKKANRKSPVDD